jgi:signal transduction histidine kinase
MPALQRARLSRYLGKLALPILALALVGGVVWTFGAQIRYQQRADEYNLREWINESRPRSKTLPDLVREYLELQEAVNASTQAVNSAPAWGIDPTEALRTKAIEIRLQLHALGVPTRKYSGQLPLFPEIYRLEVYLPHGPPPPLPLVWDSNLPRPTVSDGHGTRTAGLGFLEYRLLGDRDDRALMRLEYQLHAFNKRQQDEKERQTQVVAVSLLAGLGLVVVGGGLWLSYRREREREMQRLQEQQRIEHAERLVLENELRRQEAERKQEETERILLEQRLEAARQESRAAAAEHQALELKSQLYASIGIMAGSYAHNIKNLLVRPNDLLRRCLEADGLSPDQGQMLHEVRQTLGTVTERLQQILRTIRRDPSRSELARVDLNALVLDMQRTWQELAREKWKLTLSVELCPEPLLIEADLSHLQQAAENLLFNARDATFEMRNHLREQARRAEGLDAAARRQAVIDAAAWRGTVVLRTRREDDRAVLEVQDNGIGMTEEVRRRCTETHFSTKRDNALFEGYTAGMGLGLSFVVVILQHHRAELETVSEPLKGAVFRARFPLAHPEAKGPVP